MTAPSELRTSLSADIQQNKTLVLVSATNANAQDYQARRVPEFSTQSSAKGETRCVVAAETMDAAARWRRGRAEVEFFVGSGIEHRGRTREHLCEVL